MSATGFLTSFLSWYNAIPAAVLCYAPMTNKIRGNRRKSQICISILLIILIALISAMDNLLPTKYNTLLPVLIILSIIIYHRSLVVPLYKSVSVFIFVFAFMSFFSNYANGFDALLHPHGILNEFSLEAAIFQAFLGTAVCIAGYIPMKKYCGKIIDEFDMPQAYYVTIPVWGIFLLFNLLITPHKYETLHVNLMQLAFWGSITLFLLLYLLLCVLIYFIVSGMIESQKTAERNHILEMQESAYNAQQRYMSETSKIRHDFKHTIGALTMLVKSGDYEAVNAFLDDYIASQPQNDAVIICENTAVNALLNYYVQIARADDIPINLNISLPENTAISDVDMCGILGNMLENAILACKNVPADDRFIDLILRIENSSLLYIVETNSFDGQVKEKNGSYLSTRRHGSGLGLKSIRETAESYGGSARFSHNEKEFNTDVVLPL